MLLDGIHFHTPLVDRLDFNLTSNMESLLNSLWKAHIHSIGVAKPLFVNELSKMSQSEAMFGSSWAQLVDLIADSLLPCNQSMTNILQHLLPSKILLENDRPPKIANITRLQNRAVMLIDSINIMNEKYNGLLALTWKRLMCSENGRALGREMITLGMYRLPVLVEDGISLLKLGISLFPQRNCQ